MRTETGEGWTLHLGDWRDADLPHVDATIEDPPYSARTHGGQRHGRRGSEYKDGWVSSAGLEYDHVDHVDVACIAATACDVTSGWICEMTSHDLCPWYEGALKGAGRYVFAPVPIVMPGMNVRLAGDGPSSWSVYMVVSRRSSPKICWSTKPGAYIVTPGAGPERAANKVKGHKPLRLMEDVLRDYTARGDLVMDRFAGSGTTGVAAIRLGRRFVGWERKPEHFELALARIRAAEPQAEAFATDGIIGKPQTLPGLE